MDFGLPIVKPTPKHLPSKKRIFRAAEKGHRVILCASHAQEVPEKGKGYPSHKATYVHMGVGSNPEPPVNIPIPTKID